MLAALEDQLLADKYKDVLDLGVKLGIKNGDWKEEGGKLKVWGTAPYQMEKNLLWDKIKTPDAGWESEIAADIKVEKTDLYGVYTVVAGDTLSKISKHILSDANKYMDIFNANKDWDKIQVGQKLKIALPKGPAVLASSTLPVDAEGFGQERVQGREGAAESGKFRARVAGTFLLRLLPARHRDDVLSFQVFDQGWAGSLKPRGTRVTLSPSSVPAEGGPGEGLLPGRRPRHDPAANGGERGRVRMLICGRPEDAARLHMQIGARRVHVLRGAVAEVRARVRLVRRLVVREARIAVDAEERHHGPRVHDDLAAHAGERFLELRDQAQQGVADVPLVARLLRGEPAPVVAGQGAQEGEQLGTEVSAARAYPPPPTFRGALKRWKPRAFTLPFFHGWCAAGRGTGVAGAGALAGGLGRRRGLGGGFRALGPRRGFVLPQAAAARTCGRSRNGTDRSVRCSRLAYPRMLLLIFQSPGHQRRGGSEGQTKKRRDAVSRTRARPIWRSSRPR